MKEAIIFLSMFLLFGFSGIAQVGINTDESVPDPSAMLDVKSSTRGVLVPRMTTAQRDGISSPATGLLIFCTDNNQYYFNKGTPTTKNWVMMNSQWSDNGTSINYSAGNVGIDTTSPVEKLDVVGTIKAQNFKARDEDGFKFFDNNGNGNLNIQVLDRTEINSSDGSGNPTPICFGSNVGIGTTSPAVTLHVCAPGTTAASLTWGATAGTIFRSENSELAMGLYNANPWAYWLQARTDNSVARYMVLQPLGGNVCIGTSTPASSAALEISSTSKGFLPPRMTLADREAIASPSQGLVIYCTNCGTNGELQVYNGTSWTNLTGGAAMIIGCSFQGGKIAYILQPGDPGFVAGQLHGLIAATSDQSIAPWGCNETIIYGAFGTALGTGNQNTIAIMAGCSEAGIAARICGDLVLNGYSDWYLPSKDELNKLYQNRDAIGGFAGSYYWSSSELSTWDAWRQDFYYNGLQEDFRKSFTFCVRAVRAF